MPKPNIKKLYKSIDEHKAQELDKKFKGNPFAKKYKKSLIESKAQELYKLLEKHYEEQEALYAAEEVKSWKRSPISETVNLTYLFLAFIIGFSVCAIVLTPLIISAI